MWLTKKKDRPYYYVRFLPPDGSGKPVSRSTGATGKREAEARGKEIRDEEFRAWERSQAGGQVTSLHVIEEYWNTEACRLKAGLDHIFPHLERIQAFLGSKPYCEVTVADVARFCDQLSAAGLSDSTVNRATSIWRRMHNVAAKKRLYPVKMIDWGSIRRLEPEPEARSLPRDTVRQIGANLPPTAREIVAFAVLTGIRKGQVLNLTWDRVDLAGGTVRVYRKHRKAFALHTVEVHPTALKILGGRAQGGAEDLVFDTTNFRKDWEGALAKCGLRGNVRFHDLRHSFATWLAARAPLIVVKEQLGHSDLRVTQRYAHVAREDIRSAVHLLPGVSFDDDE